MLHCSSSSLHENVHQKRAALKVVWNLSSKDANNYWSLMKQARNADFFVKPALSVPQTSFFPKKIRGRHLPKSCFFDFSAAIIIIGLHSKPYSLPQPCMHILLLRIKCQSSFTLFVLCVDAILSYCFLSLQQQWINIFKSFELRLVYSFYYISENGTHTRTQLSLVCNHFGVL